MRLLIQRVLRAKVEVERQEIGSIGKGLLVFLGVHQSDQLAAISYLVDKICHLRIFEDEQGKMNRSLLEVQGGVLVVSQFTLYGDCMGGRRPSFIESAKPGLAYELYQAFVIALKAALSHTPCPVQTGEFGAHMQVSLVNDGPVTLLLEK